MNLLAYRLFLSGLQGSLWTLRQVDRVRARGRRRSMAEFRQDPYKSHALMRERGPVIRSYANQGWLVHGHEHVQAALRSDKLSNDIRHSRFFYWLLRVCSRDLDIPLVDKPAMLGRDRPDHTRLRKLVAAGFTQQYITSLEPMVDQLVQELLDEMEDEFELIGSLAKPLPAMVMATMMGVPVADRPRFQQWSERLTGALMIDNPGMVYEAALADQEMRAYLTGLVKEKEANPGEDFISRLLAAEVEQDQLTRDELISNCILLLTAGHETTTRLIGNAIYTLIRHPDQLQLLRDNPALMGNAIEEVLRFESPIQATLRFVSGSHDLLGYHFRRNQLVMIWLGAANRDPAFNDDPDQFDITRPDIKHVAFGFGPHLCLGLSLARLEARVALTHILHRYSDLQLLDRVADWGSNPFFRGLNSLRVKAEPATAQESAVG